MSNADFVDLRQPAELGRLIAALSALAEPSPVPLSSWAEEVMASYHDRHRNTRNRLRQALREVVALAGENATTGDLSPSLVVRFGTRSGRASTTNGLLASLRVAVKFAAASGYVRPGLVERCSFRVRDRDAPRAQHHARREIAKVLAHLAATASTWDGGRLHCFAAVLAYAGLRKTEALRLRVADVDLTRGFLWVRPNGQPLKTSSSEAPVPIPAALSRILKRWLPRCGSDWLIPRRDRLGPWVGGRAGTRAGDRLRDTASGLGIAGFTPRSLRHSLATHLSGWWGLSRGQVQLVLRHTTERTQAHYVHPDLENLRFAVRSFEYSSRRKAPRPSARVLPARRPSRARRPA